MKIGLAQIHCSVGDVDGNCRKIEELARRAGQEGCEVVIFPETTDTGFNWEVIGKAAQAWPGKAYEAARRSAAENRVYLLCGLCERVEKAIYNSLAVFSPAGELVGKYRKAHLITPPPFNEGKCFSVGDGLVTVRIGDMVWGLSICYDLRFPELYRQLALSGAQVLVNCAAWPMSRPLPWDVLTRARAVENQVYMLAVSCVGSGIEMAFGGHSRIVDPLGELVAQGWGESEELVTGELDSSRIAAARAAIPVFAARREDLYGNLNVR